MMSAWILPLAGIGAIVVGFLVGYTGYRRLSAARLSDSKRLGDSIISDAQKSAKQIRRSVEREAREALNVSRDLAEREAKRARNEIEDREKELCEKTDGIARKLDILDRKEVGLDERARSQEAKQKVLDERLSEASRLIDEHNEQLERIAGMQKEEAKSQLIKNLEDEARADAARRGREIRETAERDAKKESQKIIAQAIQRYAAEQCVETTVSVVNLPSEDMKGRIIGREGRNIRAFEMATGVDVIIDETPEAVIVSAFDPVRREIARVALQRLVEDGRIHPGRIEEVVARTTEEVDARIMEAGEHACMDLGINGLDPEMVRLVGRMRHRTSYGQNCLAHSIEVAYLSGSIASELNLDPKLARRAGLLHDIGKVAPHEMEGSHTEIGAELARRYGEPPEVIDVVHAHHGDVEATTLYTPIVAAADAISGARPGARRESLESYVKRLTKLEEIADGFDGVIKSYAIQAGREIRIIVSNKMVSDEGAADLAYNISRKFEKDLDYPGQIKVVVIRETRVIETAR